MANLVITTDGDGIKMMTNSQSTKLQDAGRLLFDKHFGIEDCSGLCVKITTNLSGMNKTMLLHHDDTKPKFAGVDSIDSGGGAVDITTHVELLDELYKLIQ